VDAGIPRPEAIHLCQAAAAVIDTGRKGKIGLSNAEDVYDVLVIKVQGDDPIVGELTLNAESVAAGVRSGKAGIDGYREVAGLEHIEGEIGRASCRERVESSGVGI